MSVLPQSALTIEEMRQGVIMLYCHHCNTTTKHQTITRQDTRVKIGFGRYKKIKKGAPYQPNSTWNNYGYCTYERKCLTCGNTQDF